jgi:hypothetical protein
MSVILNPSTYPMIFGASIRADQLLDTAVPVNLENARGVLITTVHKTGGNTDLVLTVHEGATAAVATAGTYPITTGAEFPIWVTEIAGTSDIPVRKTDAVTYTVDADVLTGTCLVQFYISAAKLTNNRMWVALGSTGGHASSIATVIYQLDGYRYKQASPLTAIA